MEDVLRDLERLSASLGYAALLGSIELMAIGGNEIAQALLSIYHLTIDLLRSTYSRARDIADVEECAEPYEVLLSELWNELVSIVK